MNLGEVAVGGEDQDAFGRLAEWKLFFAVGRRNFGDHEIPGADDLVPGAVRRLRSGGGRRQSKREHGGGDGPRLHRNSPRACSKLVMPGLVPGIHVLSE